nr:hypothetical protein [Allomuricauda sp.]
MPTSPVKVVFNCYQMLNQKEKKEVLRLINQDLSKDRENEIFSGNSVEHMTKEEQEMLAFVRHVKNTVPYTKGAKKSL